MRVKEITKTLEKEETQQPKDEGNRPDQLVALDTTILATAQCLSKQNKLLDMGNAICKLKLPM